MEYHPIDVVTPSFVVIVPDFNPLVANLFAGNALVVKVSEYASWSSRYCGRVIDAALDAVGAPRDLVQIITGYAKPTALWSPVAFKVVFVGSTGGRKSWKRQRNSQPSCWSSVVRIRSLCAPTQI